MHEMVRWSITSASSAHRIARRDRFTRRAAAAVRSSRRAPASGALAAAHADQQRGRAVLERLMRELSRMRRTRQRPAAATPPPGIRLSNSALTSPADPGPDAGRHPPDRAHRDSRRLPGQGPRRQHRARRDPPDGQCRNFHHWKTPPPQPPTHSTNHPHQLGRARKQAQFEKHSIVQVAVFVEKCTCWNQHVWSPGT